VPGSHRSGSVRPLGDQAGVPRPGVPPDVGWKKRLRKHPGGAKPRPPGRPRTLGPPRIFCALSMTRPIVCGRPRPGQLRDGSPSQPRSGAARAVRPARHPGRGAGRGRRRGRGHLVAPPQEDAHPPRRSRRPLGAQPAPPEGAQDQGPSPMGSGGLARKLSAVGGATVWTRTRRRAASRCTITPPSSMSRNWTIVHRVGQGRAAAMPRPPRRPRKAGRRQHPSRFGSNSGNIPRRIPDDEDDGSPDLAPRQGGIAVEHAASGGGFLRAPGAPVGPEMPRQTDRISREGWGAPGTVNGELRSRRPNPPFTCADIAAAADRGGIRHGKPTLSPRVRTSQIVVSV
jgi:hypothetical protein